MYFKHHQSSQSCHFSSGWFLKLCFDIKEHNKHKELISNLHVLQQMFMHFCFNHWNGLSWKISILCFSHYKSFSYIVLSYVSSVFCQIFWNPEMEQFLSYTKNKSKRIICRMNSELHKHSGFCWSKIFRNVDICTYLLHIFFKVQGC